MYVFQRLHTFTSYDYCDFHQAMARAEENNALLHAKAKAATSKRIRLIKQNKHKVINKDTQNDAATAGCYKKLSIRGMDRNDDEDDVCENDRGDEESDSGTSVCVGSVGSEDESDDECAVCHLYTLRNGTGAWRKGLEGVLLICDGCETTFHPYCVGELCHY